jgi:ATP-dependent helicase HrpA
VPGLAREKITRLAKSLPQKLRQAFGALPEFVDAFLAAKETQDAPLAQAIARYARRELNLAIPLDAFRQEMLPAHLSMNYRIVDESGRQLGMGRNLAQLRTELGQKAEEQFSEIAKADAPSAKFTAWDFGDLEEVMEIRRGSQTLIGYPGLVDNRDSVSLEAFDSADKAREAHRAGLRRLFMLQLKEQTRHIEKSLPGSQTMALQFTAFGEADELKQELLAAAFDRASLQEPWPRTRAEFERRREEARSRVTLLAQEIARLVGTILAEHAALQKKLQQTSKAFPGPCRDIQESTTRLLSKRFIEQTPYERLQHFPRYLKAAGLRLDKLRADPGRDARLAAEFAPLSAHWLREQATQAKSGSRDPQLEQFRWLLEELRVQLFAQELKTSVPVSVKRLSKMWQTIQR